MQKRLRLRGHLIENASLSFDPQEDAIAGNPTLGGKILFSSFIKKVNKRNKTEDRAVVVTERGIFKLDPKHNFKIMKDGIPLDKVWGGKFPCRIHVDEHIIIIRKKSKIVLIF